MAQKQPNPWPPEKPGVPVHHFTKPQLAAAFREWWTRFEKDPSGFDTNYPKAPPIDPVLLRQTVAGAKAIGALSAFLTTGQLAHLSEKSRDTVREIIGEWHGVPHARHDDPCDSSAEYLIRLLREVA